MSIHMTNEAWVEALYLEEYENLVAFAKQRVRDEGVAQELVQNTFQRLWEKVDTLNRHPNIRGWLRTVLKNEMIDYWRKRSVYQKYIVPYDDTVVLNAHTGAPEEQYFGLSETQVLEAARKILTQQQYQHLVRLTVDRVGHAVAAKEFGISVEASQKRLERSRAALRKNLLK